MAEDLQAEQVARGARGRFAAGSSGNPKGRPKGSRNRVTAACADLLGADAERIMARLIRSAKAGDKVALKLCVERLLPVRSARDRAVDFALPQVGRAGDLVQAAAAVIEHAASGEITLSEAREFMALLEGERKLIETADLAVRIEALEGVQSLGAGPGEEEIRVRVRRLVQDGLEKRPEEWRR